MFLKIYIDVYLTYVVLNDGAVVSQYLIISLYFFFSSRRRHTRWPRDWSSDVCSSDLPSKKMTSETKNDAMKALATELAKVTGSYRELGHPIEINWDLAPQYLKAAAEVSERLHLADPIPKLCTLVTAAAFDAAIHDAFGKANGVNCFDTCGPEFMNHDLARYLGAEYKGEYPSRYLLRQHKPRMTLCHLVSAVDPIEEFENKKPLKDGLPETLPE